MTNRVTLREAHHRDGSYRLMVLGLGPTSGPSGDSYTSVTGDELKQVGEQDADVIKRRVFIPEADNRTIPLRGNLGTLGCVRMASGWPAPRLVFESDRDGHRTMRNERCVQASRMAMSTLAVGGPH